MGWVKKVHECERPSLVSIETEHVAPGSIWQCDEDECRRYWLFRPGGGNILGLAPSYWVECNSMGIPLVNPVKGPVYRTNDTGASERMISMPQPVVDFDEPG